MLLLDGKLLSLKRLASLKSKVAAELRKTNKRPGLAVIRIGDDPASKIYVSKKVQTCKDTGFHSLEILLKETASENEILSEIDRLNQDTEIHGILVQLPVPKTLNEKTLTERIAPEKDVDGFHPMNRGRLLSGDETFVPCTPLGIMNLLEEHRIEIKGKSALVIGRSLIVGRPISLLLDRAGATVTVAHSQTKNLDELLMNAEIIVAAIGKPHFLSSQKLRTGVVIIDVGINRLSTGKLVGDLDFEKYKTVASAMTPVPGGVGPMTICSLLENTWKSFGQSSMARGV